jgi:hypothetical protein
MESENQEVWVLEFLYKKAWYKPAEWVIDSVHANGASAHTRVQKKWDQQDKTCKQYRYNSIEVVELNDLSL